MYVITLCLLSLIAVLLPIYLPSIAVYQPLLHFIFLVSECTGHILDGGCVFCISRSLFSFCKRLCVLHVGCDRWNKTKQEFTHTIDELLFSRWDDTAEVSTVLSAVFLCILPGVSVGEVSVVQPREHGYKNTYFMLYSKISLNDAECCGKYVTDNSRV